VAGGLDFIRAPPHVPCVSKNVPASGEVKMLARNRRARHEFNIEDTFEAGLVLAGSEVKSIRAGKVAMTDAYGDINRGEAWIFQLDIGTYDFAHARNHDARRKRKLLLNRREIDRLSGQVQEKGLTLVPLSLYDKKGRIKMELALVTAKQTWDKRQDQKKKESDREIERAMSRRR